MTTKTWDEMTDRERDELVAEKVMGWRRGRPERGNMPWLPPGATRSHGGVMNIPAYTTDIAAAWQVVEEMARRGYTLVCEWKGADREYAHTAEAYFRKSIYAHGHAVADTAPLAICRAALAVIESQEVAQ